MCVELAAAAAIGFVSKLQQQISVPPKKYFPLLVLHWKQELAFV